MSVMMERDVSDPFVAAAPLATLAAKGKLVVKLDGKQILLWKSGEAIYACNNRCPHEGFPLAEGTLARGCVLTCNWHNWKFDLETGETLVGGDALRLYPVRVAGGQVWLDLTDPPAEQIRAKARAGLMAALAEHDYDRIARELVRYMKADGDPNDLLTLAFDWARDSFEYGMTHAQAAAPDWLWLRDHLADAGAADGIVPLLEVLGHVSWDVRNQAKPVAFAVGRAERFDGQALEDAIEAEDETTAVRHVRAALDDHGSDALRPPLRRAALRHYQNFGHTPIYFHKTFELLDRLGQGAAEALILSQVRGLCMGQREDLIPEFRRYGPSLDAWTGRGSSIPDADAFRGQGVGRALDLISQGSGTPDSLFDVLMFAAADAMLHYDRHYRDHVDKPIAQNIDWLDFSHAITHLNSARILCADDPALWPNALLQAGCFLGRNSGFVDWDQDVSDWWVDDPDSFFDRAFARILDHGEPVYIYPAHYLKFTVATYREFRRVPDAPWAGVLLAANNRFLNEPAKRKHTRRTATQALKFVEAQGG